MFRSTSSTNGLAFDHDGMLWIQTDGKTVGRFTADERLRSIPLRYLRAFSALMYACGPIPSRIIRFSVDSFVRFPASE